MTIIAYTYSNGNCRNLTGLQLQLQGVLVVNKASRLTLFRSASQATPD